MKKHIPNAITTLNLICGCLAITTAFDGELYVAAYFLIFANFFDFADGFAARALNVSNALGEQLDSLSDMISFGVAPGVLLYQFTKHLNTVNEVQILTDNPWLFYLAFIIPVFSSFRLAKFNIDTRQTSSFIGLPTPANASFFLFVVILYFYPDLPKIIDLNSIIYPVIGNPLIMLGFGVVFSILLIAEIPMFSLKFKTMKWKDNKLPFTFILLWFILLLTTNIFAMPAIVIIYILFSVFTHYTSKTIA
jgi:CDP-diacylglycerol--serine O-phosphatidyltransferase